MGSFIHQYDEEYDALKKARRPGRGASAREDLLKMKISALQAEYDGGFCKYSEKSTITKLKLNWGKAYRTSCLRKTSRSWMSGRGTGPISPLSRGLKSRALVKPAQPSSLRKDSTKSVRGPWCDTPEDILLLESERQPPPPVRHRERCHHLLGMGFTTTLLTCR
jgi:hypothetical protein